jgi:hypothetical protein
MGGYWSDVLWTAWAETKWPFEWSKKTVAAILTACAVILIAWVRGGFADMTTALSGYLWIAAAPFLAALVLFVWNIIETQAALYADLARDTKSKVGELESRIKYLEDPPPDYAAWRHVHLLSIKQAAFLWCDLAPRISMPPNVQAWSNALGSAIRKGELDFEPKFSGMMSETTERDVQKRNPHMETIVTRISLQKFAVEKCREVPKFLQD